MIDAHVHFGSIPSKLGNFGKFLNYEKIAKIEKIKKYCVVPIGMPENFARNTTPKNDSVLQLYKKNNSVIPIYWFNVFDLPNKIDEVYSAIKFHPDIGKINIDDERVVKFSKKINLPIFVHTNENKEYSSLEKTINLAKKLDAPVIAVHSGSVTSTFFKLDNYKFPENIYFETSGIQYSVILQKIYKMFGAKKIILGSDYPFGDPRVSLAMIKTLNPSKKEIELMTEKNIKQLLKIK